MAVEKGENNKFISISYTPLFKLWKKVQNIIKLLLFSCNHEVIFFLFNAILLFIRVNRVILVCLIYVIINKQALVNILLSLCQMKQYVFCSHKPWVFEIVNSMVIWYTQTCDIHVCAQKNQYDAKQSQIWRKTKLSPI